MKIKQLKAAPLGLLATLTVFPALIIATNSTHGFTHTFFSDPMTEQLNTIKETYEEDLVLNI